MSIKVEIVESEGLFGADVDFLVFDDAAPRRDGKPVTRLLAKRTRPERLRIQDIQTGGYTGRGYGSAALRALRDFVLSHGITSVQGEIHATDWNHRDRLVRLYERFGATVSLDEESKIGRVIWRAM